MTHEYGLYLEENLKSRVFFSEMHFSHHMLSTHRLITPVNFYGIILDELTFTFQDPHHPERPGEIYSVDVACDHAIFDKDFKLCFELRTSPILSKRFLRSPSYFIFVHNLFVQIGKFSDFTAVSATLPAPVFLKTVTIPTISQASTSEELKQKVRNFEFDLVQDVRGAIARLNAEACEADSTLLPSSLVQAQQINFYFRWINIPAYSHRAYLCLQTNGTIHLKYFREEHRAYFTYFLTKTDSTEDWDMIAQIFYAALGDVRHYLLRTEVSWLIYNNPFYEKLTGMIGLLFIYFRALILSPPPTSTRKQVFALLPKTHFYEMVATFTEPELSCWNIDRFKTLFRLYISDQSPSHAILDIHTCYFDQTRRTYIPLMTIVDYIANLFAEKHRNPHGPVFQHSELAIVNNYFCPADHPIPVTHGDPVFEARTHNFIPDSSRLRAQLLEIGHHWERFYPEDGRPASSIADID